MRSDLNTRINSHWIYTYDYAPESIWEPWRDEVYSSGGLDCEGVPLWIDEEAERVCSRIKPGLPAWILIADSHFVHNGTWEDTVSSMRALADRIKLKGVIHLGDLTDGLLSGQKTREAERRCVSDMESLNVPVYITPGNHDYNYFRGNPDIMYPKRPQYYVDDEENELRLIFIDSFDPAEQVRYGFTDYCVHWLESTLHMLPRGYSAIVFSHMPPLVRLQAWTDNIRNREKLIAVLDKYADRMIAFINGHNHCDHIFNDLKNGQFPVISINCSKCEYFTEHKPEGAVVPFRALGGVLQESFDIMQADTKRRELEFIRFGAGQDRKVKDHRAEWTGGTDDR